MDPVVKEFHHLDPAEKLFNIGNSWQTRSMVQIVAEVAKCVILCANCHKRVEAGVIELPGENNEPSNEPKKYRIRDVRGWVDYFD